MSGMDGGVVFGPAVPGLAPRGFYGSEGGVARVIEPALQASAGRIAILEGKAVRHKSPQRELGDCDVAHQLASQAQAVSSNGVV